MISSAGTHSQNLREQKRQHLEDNVKYLPDQTNTTVCTSQALHQLQYQRWEDTFHSNALANRTYLKSDPLAPNIQGIKILSEQDAGSQNGNVLGIKARVREVYRQIKQSLKLNHHNF